MREKMEQIFDAIADITLNVLNTKKEAKTYLDEQDIEMVSATLQLYNVIANNHQPELFPR